MIEIDGSFRAIWLKAQSGTGSKRMHQLKTAYPVYFNRRHQVVGHLFEGRFKRTVIEAEKYLLEVSRYLHLNSVARTIRRTKTHDVQTLKV